MKNVLLIGLGRFGRHIAMQLNQLGHEVMAVDWKEERVDKVLSFVTAPMLNFYSPLELETMTFVLCPLEIAFRILSKQHPF